jgi:hypothetical protein
MLSALDALTIASVCIFLAGIAVGRRSNEAYRIHFLITSPHYAAAFLALGLSPINENYGLNPNVFIALFTLFVAGSAGEKISRTNWRRDS